MVHESFESICENVFIFIVKIPFFPKDLSGVSVQKDKERAAEE